MDELHPAGRKTMARKAREEQLHQCVAVVPMPTCPKCSQITHRTDKFCGSCGVNLALMKEAVR